MKIKNKNFLIFGLGKSGEAVFNFLQTKGANIFLYDKDKKKYSKYILSNQVRIFDKNKHKIDTVVISPGISRNDEMKKFLISNNYNIMSEIELAYRFTKSKIIAITGTNGKTTVVSLLSHILKVANISHDNVGNIGTPFISIAGKIPHKRFVILEVSSFQLEFIDKFQPYISCITNLGVDHLCEYENLDSYHRAKLKIYKNQKKGFILYNGNNTYSKKYFINQKINPHLFSFTNASDNHGDIFDDEKSIYIKNKSEIEPIIEKSKIKLIGQHNIQNIMCAIFICKKIGIKSDVIQKAIETFQGVPHRLEFVQSIDGIDYINDSKATNVASTLNALDSLTKYKTILCMVGGSDKQEDFDDLMSRSPNYTFFVIYGATREKLTTSAKKYNRNFQTVQNFEQAFNYCRESANSGDCILLSPACASFDEFNDFEERGKIFKEYVYEVKKN